MKMINSKINISVFAGLFFLLLGLTLICFQFCNDIEVYKYLFVITGIITFTFIFLKAKSIFHIHMLYFLAFYYFVGGIVVLDLLFNNIDFAKTSFFTQYTFSESIQKEMLQIVSVAQLAIFFSSFTINCNKKEMIKLNSIRIKQFCFIVFYIAIIIKAYSVFLIVKQVFSYGYISIYLKPVQIPPIVRMGDDLFLPSLALLFCLNLTENERKTVYCTGLFIAIFSLFTGGRADGLSLLVLLICLINKHKRIRNKTIFLLFIILLCLVLSVQFLRVSEKINIASVLTSLSGAVMPAIGYGIKYKESFTDPLAILFNNFISYINYFTVTFTGKGFLPIFPQGPSADFALKGHDSAARLSYLANSQFYLSGMGVGTSCYLEFYWLGGLITVFLLTVLSITFINYLEKHFNNNLVLRFFYIIFIGGWLLSNRTAALDYLSIFYLLKFLPLIFISFLLFYYLKEIKKHEKNIVCDV